MNHHYITPTECGCDNEFCNICVGGLDVCSVCGLFEGGLTTHCPGVKAYGKSDEVYAGKIDFRDGQWVEGVTIHMQHIYGKK